MPRLRDGISQLEQNDEYKSFVSWLSAPDPWINQNKASKLRHKHTGNWFLESNVYQEWLLTARSPLWLHGIPGCGKTILASTIIQNLLERQQNDSRVAVIFYYFDFNDVAKQTYDNLIRSLVMQLVSRLTLVSKHAYASWRSQYQQQTEGQLMPMLHQLLKSFERVYLVVDALDEGGETDDLLRIMQQCTSWDDINVHTMFGSRKRKDIEEVLRCFCNNKHIVGIQTAFVDNDIRDYVQSKLCDDMKLQKWRNKPKIQQLIADSLMEKAKGMFRWAACQLDVLGKCLTEAKLQEALHDLPQTLDETYARILHGIKKEGYQHYAFIMLQWLCYSERPLRLEELAEVVAVTDREPFLDQRERLADPQDVLTICSTLITTETNYRVRYPDIFDCQCRGRISYNGINYESFCPHAVFHRFKYNDRPNTYARLAHFSVKEFLTSSRIQADAAHDFSICELNAHVRIYTTCLACLLHVNKVARSQADRYSDCPLIFYATHFWHSHARFIEESQCPTSAPASRFILNRDDSFTNWLSMSREVGPPLYHASHHGLYGSVQMLLDRGVDVNAAGGRHGTAIKVAALHGHERVVEILINNGANVNTLYWHAPLAAAARNGHSRVVRQLLDSGADVNGSGKAKEVWDTMALEEAITHLDGHIVQMLLESGVSIESWQAALNRSIINDLEPATRRLLHHDIKASNVRDESIGAALFKAIKYTKAPAVKLLLGQIDSTEVLVNDLGQTPLSYAASLGQLAIFSMLIHHTSQGVDFADRTGRTPLSYAAESGEEAILNKLVEYNDQNIDLPDESGRTPLSYAAGAGPRGYKTSELLLRHERVNALSQDYVGRRALSHAATASNFRVQVKSCVDDHPKNARRMKLPSEDITLDESKHQSLVKMFLNYDDSAFKKPDKYGWTPLSWAIAVDYYHIVELLLPRGQQGLHSKSEGGETPAMIAFRKGSTKIIRLLEKYEVIDLRKLGQDGQAWHRASHAASCGHTDLLDLLFKNGIPDFGFQDEQGRTLASFAAEKGYESTLALLLKHDSSMVDRADKSGRTPLSYVCSGRRGVGQKAKLLLGTYAVAPDLPNENCRAPISYAAEVASFELVQSLLLRNVDIDRPDDRGRTPLSYAAGKAFPFTKPDDRALQSILKKSTNGKDCEDHAARTPLSYAAEEGSMSHVKLLLNTGLINWNKPDKRGLTPLAYAEMEGECDRQSLLSRKKMSQRKCVARILRRYGAYRLDLENLPSQGTDSYAESGGSTIPDTSEHSVLNTLSSNH